MKSSAGARKEEFRVSLEIQAGRELGILLFPASEQNNTEAGREGFGACMHSCISAAKIQECMELGILLFPPLWRGGERRILSFGPAWISTVEIQAGTGSDRQGALSASSQRQVSSQSPLASQAAVCNFPAGFPNDFLGRLAEKIANDNHVTAEHLAIGHKCEQAAQNSNCNHMTTGVCVIFCNGWNCFICHQSPSRGRHNSK